MYVYSALDYLRWTFECQNLYNSYMIKSMLSHNRVYVYSALEYICEMFECQNLYSAYMRESMLLHNRVYVYSALDYLRESFECECPYGYTGTFCETAVECSVNNCVHGTCHEDTVYLTGEGDKTI